MRRENVTMDININFKFLSGGHALFTVGSPRNRFTFKIIKKPDSPFYVSYLTGKDNTKDYTYLGCFIPLSKDRFLKLTNKSRLGVASQPVKVFEWAAEILAGRKDNHINHPNTAGCYIIHAGKCCACGRQLTTPASIKNGIGPVCVQLRDGAKKIKPKKENQAALF